MNLVTYVNISQKCYINLFNIVPGGMGCFNVLANAIDKFQTVSSDLKKIEYGFHLTCFHLQSLGLGRIIFL